jgi:hypothetical protein
MLSVTVTDLDNFRRYREDEEMSLAELMKRLRREEGPSDVMRAGTALHSILEESQGGDLVTADRDGHRFIFTLDAEIALLPFRELYGKRTYSVNGTQIEVRGKTDATTGLLVEDHKFSCSPFDAEKHFSRYQWRLYLSIFGADAFAYNVFTGKFIETDEDGILVWEVRDFNRLVLYRYPELEADIERELARFGDFVHEHLCIPNYAA